MRDQLDEWLSEGGRIRIVPAGAFAVAVLLGIIPMWLEFGAFPRWAPREAVGTPLLLAWIAVFLATELSRRSLGRRGTRRWVAQYRDTELDRADQLAGAADRLCVLALPKRSRRPSVDEVRASLLQGIVDTLRVTADLDPAVKVNASLLVPEMRRRGRRIVEYLTVVCANRVGEHPGWESIRADGLGPAQDAYREGRYRLVPDSRAEGGRDLSPAGGSRTLLVLPVVLRGPGGKRIAVVAIDASEPGVFTDALVRSLLEPMVRPHLKLIALSLILETLDRERTEVR